MGTHMKRRSRRKSRKSRKRRGGKVPMGPIKSAKALTMGATAAASKGAAMADSATEMCGHIKNMFLKAEMLFLIIKIK